MRLVSVVKVAVVVAALAAGAVAGAAAKAGEACKSDGECALGTICGSANVCVPIQKRRNVIPFYFHQPGDSGYRHVIPFGYFHSWDHQGSVRVAVPWFGRSHDYAKQKTTTVVPLLFTSRVQTPEKDQVAIWPFIFGAKYKDGGAQAAVLPLFWWQRHAGKSLFVAPLLASGGSYDARTDTTVASTLLVGFYRRHGENDIWRVLFPIFFEHEKDGGRTLLGPLLYFHRDRERQFDTVFPLFWYRSDSRRGYEESLALPLFDYASDNHGRKLRFISILGSYTRDDDAGTKQLLVYAPIIYHRSDPLRRLDIVPPFYAGWHAKDGSSRGAIVGPFATVGDLDGSTTTLFPIYWRFRDDVHDASTNVIFPIAGWHRRPGARGAYVGPVYGWSSSNGAGGWGGGVAPLFFFGRNGPRRHALVLPIFARTSDDQAGTSTTAVGPVWWHTSRDGADGGLFPLVFAGRHGKSSYGLVPGLVLHRKNENGTTDVVGPGYVYRGRRGWAAGLAPLAFFGNLDGNSHQVVFPILFRFANAALQRERMLVGPFYHRRDHDETADVLFPLFYLRKNPRDGLGLWPNGAWYRDPDSHAETTVALPFVHQSNPQKHSRTNMFFPLVTVHDSPTYSIRLVFPLVWRVRDHDETDTAVVPFYFRTRSPRLAVDVVFPLVFSARSQTANTTVAGPFWYRARRDGGRSAGLFPIAAFGRKMIGERSSSWFAMPGLFWSDNQVVNKRLFLFGPFYRAADASGYQAGLVPLAFAWRKDTVSHVLAPLFYRRSDAAAQSSINVLGPAYVTHDPHTTRVGLAPLFFVNTHSDGTFNATLLPLFYGAKRNNGSTLFTPLFGWQTFHSYPEGSRFYVGPFYWRRDQRRGSVALWPLFYHTRDQDTGSRVTLVPPLLSVDWRGSDGHEVQAYTLLAWRYHSIESTVLFGLPLFFDVNQFRESRTTGFLPFFIRHNNRVSASSSWIVPPVLAWWRKSDGGKRTDFAVFPLVWHFGGDRPTTIVAPFVWDFVRGESRTTVFAPIGAHWRRSDGVHTLVLNTYYRKGIGPKAGSWYVDFFPLIAVGRPRKQDLQWYFLEGLFGYQRQGRNRSLRLFWVLDVPLQPIPESNLSWFGSTPTSARGEVF